MKPRCLLRIILLILLLSPISVFATEWAKTYGGSSSDYVKSIQQTTDGGYIVAGSTYSFAAGVIDFWVLKLDSSGNVTWQKTYGGSGGDSASSIQQTTDDGYIVAGYTNSFAAGVIDFWVLKLDSSGNVTWQKTYGGSESDFASSIQQTTDGGYIVAGSTHSFGAGDEDFWVLKLDSSGNVTWQKTYGGSGGDSASSIQQTTDGGYIVAGSTHSFGAGSSDIWILKLDSSGEISGCDIIKTSNAPVSNTSVTPGNSSIVGSTSNALIFSTNIQPKVTSAVVSTICVPTFSISGTVSGDVIEGITMTLSGSGSETTLTNTSGNYTFIGLSNGSYTVTPNKSLYTFTPASRTVSIANSNVTGVSFTSSRCSYSISPTSQFFDSQGGTGVINVTSFSNCTWYTQSNVSWITITSGSSGTGNGTIYYSVASNISSVTTNPRTGIITVGDQTFTVTQEGRTCTYSISPSNQEYSYSGGTGYINVTATSGCSWNAQSSTSWITITSGKSGTGDGIVNYSVAANTSACPRTGTITIADQSVSITQQSVSCSYSISPKEQFFSTSGGIAYITVTTESCCTWTATCIASWVTITSGSTGTGNGTVNYSVAANNGSQRTGIITIAGQTFTVKQDGTPITECTTWTEVIDKYNTYVSGQAAWNDVIECYNQYVSP